MNNVIINANILLHSSLRRYTLLSALSQKGDPVEAFKLKAVNAAPDGPGGQSYLIADFEYVYYHIISILENISFPYDIDEELLLIYIYYSNHNMYKYYHNIN